MGVAPTTLPAALRATAVDHPDNDALVCGQTRLTYRDLDEAVIQCARGLIALGVTPGDRVSIWAQNCWQWCVACMGILAAGGVVVPINTRFRGREAAYIVENSQSVALFTTTGFLGADYPQMLRSAASATAELPIIVMDGETSGSDLLWEQFLDGGEGVPRTAALTRMSAISPNDTSDIMYTSGSTGFPKGVVQTHANNLVAMRALGAALQLTPHDRNLVLAPLFAQFGLRCGLFIDLLAGATTVLESVFDEARVLDLIAEQHISMLPGPPTILAALLAPQAAGRDLSSLRIAITGSTVIPEELVIELTDRKIFDNVFTAYGLTEACGPVSVSSPDDTPAQVSRFAGKVMPHVELRVVDKEGKPVPAGQRGELMVRSSTVMSEYLNDSVQTAAAFDADGWLHTGDVGALNSDGYLQITGRVKDMVIVGGLNVYPAEVEAVMREHVGIRDVALIGVADDRLGEVGAAFVVPESGAILDSDALYTWCREVLANYKVPRFFWSINELPLNSSLKVDKVVLRQRATELGYKTATESA